MAEVMDDSNTERLLERLVRLVVEDRLLRVLFLCGFLLEDMLVCCVSTATTTKSS